jgi:hypothetical protein
MWWAYVDMTAPEVSVTAANGGEGWPVEFVRHIQWSTQDAGGVDTVAIFLSRDGGATWPETLAHGIDDTGDFTWVVTGPFSTQCRLRVRAWDLAGNVDEDESDANFTIGPQTLDVNEAMATGVALLPIAPNPGRAPFAFRFELTAASDVSVQVFDASGRRVRAFASEQRASGPHVVTWDGRDDADRVMGDGVYWALVRAAGVQRTRRFVLLR